MGDGRIYLSKICGHVQHYWVSSVEKIAERLHHKKMLTRHWRQSEKMMLSWISSVATIGLLGKNVLGKRSRTAIQVGLPVKDLVGNGTVRGGAGKFSHPVSFEFQIQRSIPSCKVHIFPVPPFRKSYSGIIPVPPHSLFEDKVLRFRPVPFSRVDTYFSLSS